MDDDLDTSCFDATTPDEPSDDRTVEVLDENMVISVCVKTWVA